VTTTAFLVALTAATEQACRQVDELAFHLDNDQYVQAGDAIGSLSQLGRRISELAYFAKESAASELWNKRQQEKAVLEPETEEESE
jgi:hypothetical protein